MIKPYKMPSYQIEGFKEQAEKQFIRESVEFLKKYFLPQVENLSNEELTDFVKNRFAEAEEYDIETKPEYLKWLIVTMNLGTRFMHNILYQGFIEPYIEISEHKKTLAITALMDDVIAKIGMGILPKHPGIGPHLKDIKPISSTPMHDYVSGITKIDNKKYQEIGFERVRDFLLQEDKYYNLYNIKGADKSRWYFALVWYLGSCFLDNPCYAKLKDIFQSSDDASSISIFLTKTINQYHKKEGAAING